MMPAEGYLMPAYAEGVFNLPDGSIKLKYSISAGDLSAAGEASSNVKKMLTQLGVASPIIKKTSVAMYEAEINAVIHAGGGTADVVIDKDKILITITDNGPGIEDIELAMQEGYTTAPDSIREMGFGAGMGLPNIKRYSDEFEIESTMGEGTVLKIAVYLKKE